MARELKISMATGRVDVADLPAEAERSDRTLALVAEITSELDQLEASVEGDPRGALKRAWVLRTYLDAHPINWIRNYQERQRWSAADKRLKALREAALAGLPEGEGARAWDELPYIRSTLELVFDRLKAKGDVDRLILTPLGGLKWAKVNYQRDSAEDLERVCGELDAAIRASAGLDAEVRRWGPDNRDALLRGQPPRSIPAAMRPSAGAAIGGLLLGLALDGGGAALLSGQVIADGTVPGAACLGLGLLATGVGALGLSKASKARAALPLAFAELSSRFRERLYLVCVLRVLYQSASAYSRANAALEGHLERSGGKDRWKRVKLEARDLTEVFATGTWGEKATVEHWLGEQVKEHYRMASNKLAAPEDLDDQAWDMLFKAYTLDALHDGGEGADAKLLDAVADLTFTRRGEDTAAERKAVFAKVERAWLEHRG